MSLRYARLFDTTVRAEYERALDLAKNRLGPLPNTGSTGPDTGSTGPDTGPDAPTSNTDWVNTPTIKTRLGGGYCLRAPAQGACPYANICEHCPSFHSEPAFLPVLTAQRADVARLADDATSRGWNTETERQRRLLARLDALLAHAAG